MQSRINEMQLAATDERNVFITMRDTIVYDCILSSNVPALNYALAGLAVPKLVPLSTKDLTVHRGASGYVP